ncbi:MAG: class I fructose-bisphosphate aldolase [Chitinivibrionales bacterium]|nr:class I fructose-bisphosphate aldolase [Chitinivibrionales bacterium]
MSVMTIDIENILGNESKDLLEHTCCDIPSSMVYQPGPNWIDDVYAASDRSPTVLRNLSTLISGGRLAGTGYISILPVDHGVEHTAGSAFVPNPIYFDPEQIVRLALEAQCSAVASTLGVLGSVAHRYAHKIPFIVKLNHNELLSYPNTYDQRIFASVKQAFEMGAIGVGATIYFGSPESRRQIEEVSRLFEHAHRLGLVCVLWCYLRNTDLQDKNKDLQIAADLTGQANHLGATIQADIVKQKLPVPLHGFEELKYSKSDPLMYEKLMSDHIIDLVRYQVANTYMGRCGLINSGGASGKNDLEQVVRTAVINKRAGGMGVISGRKAFQRPFNKGVELLNAIQDVYLDEKITVA